MHDTKPWYTSVGVWGALVSAAASLLALFHVRLDPQLQSDLRDWLISLSTLLGAGAALYGRLRATRRILGPSRVTEPQHWRMNATAALLCPVWLLLLLSQSPGCAALANPSAAYVDADRATHDAVAPEYAAYVHADPTLDEEQKARRDRTLATWDGRIRAAEGKDDNAGGLTIEGVSH